jgi:hypothetical protein
MIQDGSTHDGVYPISITCILAENKEMSNNNATDQADVQASQAPQEQLWRRHAVMLGPISN